MSMYSSSTGLGIPEATIGGLEVRAPLGENSMFNSAGTSLSDIEDASQKLFKPPEKSFKFKDRSRIKSDKVIVRICHYLRVLRNLRSIFP